MSVIYSAEEQKSLKSLTQNKQFFSVVHELLQKGQFPGAAASVLLETFLKLESLIKENEQKIAAIEQEAKQRSESEELQTGTK